MAHVTKFTKGALYGISIHNERKTEAHTNEDIDIAKSDRNYDLCEKPGDLLSRLNTRLEEVDVFQRKDVKVAGSWVVTLPESLKNTSEDEQRLFFEKTYTFLENRYGGAKNTLSAYVHNDETTPHMHFVFVPTVFDEKKGREKVNAKQVINRKDLQSFHSDLDNYLKEELPQLYKEGILNEKTIGIESVKEIKQLDEAIARARIERSKRLKEVKGYRDPLKTLNELERTAKRSILEKIQLNKDEWLQISNLVLQGAKEKHVFRNQRQELQKNNEILEEAFGKVYDENEELKQTTQFQQNEIYNLKQETKNLKEMLEKNKRFYEDNSLVYRHVLEEQQINPKKVEEMDVVEWQARSVVQEVKENGISNHKKELKNDIEILEKAKEENMLVKGLEECLQILKIALEKLMKKRKKLRL